MPCLLLQHVIWRLCCFVLYAHARCCSAMFVHQLAPLAVYASIVPAQPPRFCRVALCATTPCTQPLCNTPSRCLITQFQGPPHISLLTCKLLYKTQLSATKA